MTSKYDSFPPRRSLALCALLVRQFEGTGSFNQDISRWETGAVTNMVRMFNYAGAFDRDLSHWEINSAFTDDTSTCQAFLQGATAWINGIGPAGYPPLPSVCLATVPPGR